MFTAQVTGYLTGRPEVRNAGDRNSVATIRIGVKENRRRERDDEGMFLDIEIWNEQADNAEEYLRTGDKITAAGEIVQQTWRDKDSGERRSKWIMRGRIVEYPDKSESGRRDDRDRDDDRRDRGRSRDRDDDRGRSRDRDRRDDRDRDDRDRGDPGPREPQGRGRDLPPGSDDLPF